jgi:hypothetical protein
LRACHSSLLPANFLASRQLASQPTNQQASQPVCLSYLCVCGSLFVLSLSLCLFCLSVLPILPLFLLF